MLDLTGTTFRDKVRGCWVGKNCGGTLGTPIEEALGRPEPFDVWWYPELREGGLPNDDLEMQLIWLTALEQVGPGLTARDLARYWLDHIGYNWDEYGLSKTNLRLGLEPPVSGHYNNWFIDCMGCPIRSEIWACVAPGHPRLAARYAYEDAICDHAGGESVFGELFNVAIQSAGFVVSDPRRLIDIGLSYVPEDSLTAKAVKAALRAHDEGLSWQEARARVLEATPSHVAQFSPLNMGFQVIGLLWGKDFGDALCITVNCGYDTDSSGGTIGSWLGIVAGDSGLPTRWTEPFGEAISTNEDWGGVRHLTDGSTPIPLDLNQVVDRVAAMAQRVLAANGLTVRDGAVEVDEADLYADDSVRELWRRSPLLVEHRMAGLSIGVDYLDGPAAVPTSTKALTTRLANPHPDPVTATARLIVPEGWQAPSAQVVEIPPASAVTVSWDIAVPDRSRVANTNRLFLDVELAGYPQQPAVPVALVGAIATRVSERYPAEGRSAGQLLQTPFPPEAQRPDELTASARDGSWKDLTVLGNRLPLEQVLDQPGVVYVQTFFQVPEALDVLLGVDAGCPVSAWLNGKQLFSLDRHRPIRPAYGSPNDGYLEVRFEQGWNELVVKLVREEGADLPECHLLASTAGRLNHGLPTVGRTRFPWDH